MQIQRQDWIRWATYRTTHRCHQTQENSRKIIGKRRTTYPGWSHRHCHNVQTMSQLEQLESEKKDINAIKGNVNKHCSDKKRMKMKCNNCGLEHPLRPWDRCPAYGSKCMNCHKDNHWAKVCRSNPTDWHRQEADKEIKQIPDHGTSQTAETDETEDLSVEIAETETKENLAINLKRSPLNSSQLMLLHQKPIWRRSIRDC